jgi:hypothetical protein
MDKLPKGEKQIRLAVSLVNKLVHEVVDETTDETFDFDYCHDHILLKHKKYLQSKEEARENAQAFREWIQTGNFEYQDKLYNMIQKNIRV